ncbi:MAG TPA: hypothetical protein VFB99_07890, partial [Vicinamibacterales bacterium]|nr:hypothetical protein [Vicinamibacterales bacterium]
MGEYAVRQMSDGTTETAFKLGVMDDWRYVRRSEAKRILETWGEVRSIGDISGALADPATLWRFPFHKEDGKVDDIGSRSMFETVTVLAWPELFEQFNHKTWRPYEAAEAGRGPRVYLPCFYSEEFKALERSGFVKKTGEPKPELDVYGERYDEHGNARTLFVCGYCA